MCIHMYMPTHIHRYITLHYITVQYTIALTMRCADDL